jgi:hypothetical protein
MFLTIIILFLLTFSIFAFCQNRTLVNETFSSKYIFQSDYTGNYTDQIKFCKELHNTDLIQFDSNDEYTLITEIVMTKGSFIIGLYIPAYGDYRDLTWVDGTRVNLNLINLIFKNGLPQYSSCFRFFYMRGSIGDLNTGNWFGYAICKQRLHTTVLTSSTSSASSSSILSSSFYRYFFRPLFCGCNNKGLNKFNKLNPFKYAFEPNFHL